MHAADEALSRSEPDDQAPNPRLRKAFIVTALVTFTVLMHVTFPNLGGSGLLLPQNNAVWIGFSIMLGIAIWPASRGRIRLNAFHKGMGLLLLALWLPFLWSWNEASLVALPRLLTVTAGALLIFGMSQLQLTRRDWWWIGMIILCGVLLELLYCYAQLYLLGPDNWVGYDTERRQPFGIFQQRNILASFVVTGLALSPWLATESPSSKGRAVALLAPLLAPTIIWFNGSLTGWIATGVVTPIALLYLWQQDRRLLKQWSLAFLVGILTAAVLWSMESAELPRTAESLANNTGARLQAYTHSVAMITEHPLSGWGYGRFQHDFLHTLAEWRTGDDKIFSLTFHHPHNEILLWGVEGGLLPMLAIIAFAIWVSVVSLRHSRKAGTYILLVALVPMGLHSMTEFPFYSSAIHWMVYVLLLGWLSERVWPTTEHDYRYSFSVKCASLLFAPAAVLFFVTSLYSVSQITSMFTRGGTVASLTRIVNPIANHSEIMYFIHTINLQQSFRLDDAELERESIEGLLAILKTHPNTVTYEALTSEKIKHYDNEWIKKEAETMFPENFASPPKKNE